MSLTALLFIVFFPANAYSFPIGVTITPGYIEEDKQVTESEIKILHDRLNNEQFEAIYDNASIMMKQAISKDAFINAMKQVRQDSGNFIKITGKQLNVIVEAPVQIRVVYVSTFEKLEVTELFIYIKEDGRNITLYSYQLLKGPTKLRNPEAYKWFEQGKVDFQHQEYAKAIEDYTKAIVIDPNYSLAYCDRGVIYAYKGDYNNAYSDFNKAIEINPQDAEAYFFRGILHRKNNKLDQAIEDYSQAIQIKSDFLYAYSNRGVAYMHKNEIDKAIADFSKAIELNPKLGFLYFNRGNMYEGRKDAQKALADYNKAIEVDPDYAMSYYSKACILETMNDLQGARHFYKEFLQRADNNYSQYIADARQRLSKLGE